MRAGPRAGWSLVEVLIASSLALVVFGKVAALTRTSFQTAGSESSMMTLDDGAQRAMDRIAHAIMGSDREALLPTIEAVHSSNLRYQVCLGLEAGELVWSDTEEIEVERINDLVWKVNPDEAAERRATWTRLVRPFLEGEVPNGIDDNGNGLIDETGLSFVLDGEQVVIRLTLETTNAQGQPVTRTVESRVTCRN